MYLYRQLQSLKGISHGCVSLGNGNGLPNEEEEEEELKSENFMRADDSMGVYGPIMVEQP